MTADICAPLERRASGWWWLAFLVAFSVLLLGVAAVTYQLVVGIGTWGLNRSVGWAFDITNFVFWIGIGHAGTLISAILFLFRQKWRTSVNRSAEAMTLFAVMCAGLFPVIHMGRPWLFYWIFPYPNWRGPLWINFRSPLVWDFFAISTYFLISLVFWYVGLIPDVATLRDRLRPGWYRRFVGLLSLGWNGSYRTWRRYEIVYLLLAGLATPLVVSVHSVVSTDFAAAILPGWHSTIFPPYFVAGAIFSGMAMVLTLMLIVRKVLHLEDYLTPRHVDAMTKLVLATSCLVGLSYAIEFFTAFYAGNPYETFTFLNRAFGPLGWAFAIMVACNVLIPQLFWFRSRPPPTCCGFCDFHPGECRHVDGAVCHHRGVVGARFPAVHLDQLHADLDRDGHVPRQFRPVLHLFPGFLPLLAGDCHGRDQGRPGGQNTRSARKRARGNHP